MSALDIRKHAYYQIVSIAVKAPLCDLAAGHWTRTGDC
jgi:hypothetical protein